MALLNAVPGIYAYYLDGKPVGFINSDDCKLKLTGYAPLVIKDELGIVRPLTGSLSADGKAPKIVGIIEPSTGEVSIDGKLLITLANLVEPTLGALAASGKVPTVKKTAFPAKGSLLITEQSVSRWVGLQIHSSAPVLVKAEIVYPTLETLSFSGKVVDVSVVPPDSHTVIPQTLAWGISGKQPSPGIALTVPIGAIVATGKTPITAPVVYPVRARLKAVGKVPIVGDTSLGQVGILIQGPFNYGTIIRNYGAAEYDSKINVDARTGFKVKPGALISDAYGVLTEPDHADRKHPADMGQRARREHHTGATRPSDIGRETFIDPDDPVDPDDY